MCIAEVGWIEGCSILAAVGIVGFVGASNNYDKQQQFAKLNRVKDNVSVKTVRAGMPVSVLTSDLLVGDVIVLEVGDKIPADGVLIQGNGLQCNEAQLTGSRMAGWAG